MNETRKISAILAADVVGFSRLAAADENRTLARLRAGDSENPPTIDKLSPDALRGELDRAAFWGSEVPTRKGTVISHGPPRMDVVRDIMALAAWDANTIPQVKVWWAGISPMVWRRVLAPATFTLRESIA